MIIRLRRGLGNGHQFLLRHHLLQYHHRLVSLLLLRLVSTQTTVEQLWQLVEHRTLFASRSDPVHFNRVVNEFSFQTDLSVMRRMVFFAEGGIDRAVAPCLRYHLKNISSRTLRASTVCQSDTDLVSVIMCYGEVLPWTRWALPIGL